MVTYCAQRCQAVYSTRALQRAVRAPPRSTFIGNFFHSSFLRVASLCQPASQPCTTHVRILRRCLSSSSSLKINFVCVRELPGRLFDHCETVVPLIASWKLCLVSGSNIRRMRSAARIPGQDFRRHLLPSMLVALSQIATLTLYIYISSTA